MQNQHFITHGMRKHPLYRVYWCMKTRCNNPNTIGYGNWGGRGIKCLWNTFEDFRDDMLESYIIAKGENNDRRTSLDRIDNNGNYSKENCRWVDMKTQQRNKRNNLVLEFRGEKHNVSDWADILKIDRSLVYNRLRRGWTAEQSLTLPLRGRI